MVETKKPITKFSVARDQQVESLHNLIVNTDHKWAKNWATSGFNQQNSTNKEYSGRNQLRLFEEAVTKNYADPRWMTFNQISNSEFKLEKGAKGALIEYFTTDKSVLKVDENNKPILDNDGKKQYIVEKLDKPIYKSYFVFNASKIVGIEKFIEKEITQEMQAEKYKKIDLMIDKYCNENKISINEIASSQAFFRTEINIVDKIDNYKIIMPLKDQFKNLDSYYSVLFHELSHSTSHKLERTNRDNLNKSFGSKNYAKEELTAELSLLFLCQKDGIIDKGEDKNTNLREQSLSYLKSWIKSGLLEKDDLGHSLNDALKAVNFISSYDLTRENELKKMVFLEIEPTNLTTKEGEHIKYTLKDNKDNLLFSEISLNTPKSTIKTMNEINKFLKENNFSISKEEQQLIKQTLDTEKSKDKSLSL